jgi:hypothetical protein
LSFLTTCSAIASASWPGAALTVIDALTSVLRGELASFAVDSTSFCALSGVSVVGRSPDWPAIWTPKKSLILFSRSKNLLALLAHRDQENRRIARY